MKAVQKLAAFTSLVICASAAMAFAFIGPSFPSPRDGHMAHGLNVGGLPVGDMTREEARSALERFAKDRLKGPALILSVGDESRVWEFSPEEAGLAFDVESTLKKAEAVGRTGGFPDRLRDTLSCAVSGKTIEPDVTLDEKKLSAALAPIDKELRREPKNATVTFEKGGIMRAPAVAGRRLDMQGCIDSVKEKLRGLSVPVRATVASEDFQPKVKTEDVMTIDSVLSQFTTYYGSGGNRGSNIELAAAALDGTIIRPGEEFSFNATVGSRDASAGYSDAPVIINGKVEPGIGGGVCQVSTTLYDAALLAGLTITDRDRHAYPSSYIDAGLDATVSDGLIDMRFRNTLPHSVAIASETGDGTLSFLILGAKTDDPGDIRLETEILGPRPTVDVYRVTYVNDVETNREFLHTDIYDVPPPPEPEPKPAAAAQAAPSPEAPAPAFTPVAATEPEPVKPTPVPPSAPKPEPTVSEPEPTTPAPSPAPARTPAPKRGNA